MGSLAVPRNQGNFVHPQAVDSDRVLRSAMTKPRLLSRMLPRRNVAWSHREHASKWPNLYPSCLPLRSVWMSPRRFAQGPGPTQGRSRSLLSRNGVIFLLRSLVLPKSIEYNDRRTKKFIQYYQIIYKKHSS